jgi:serine/threonine protein kinase/tetratricopeptide (TPR) repeat protein
MMPTMALDDQPGAPDARGGEAAGPSDHDARRFAPPRAPAPVPVAERLDDALAATVAPSAALSAPEAASRRREPALRGDRAAASRGAAATRPPQDESALDALPTLNGRSGTGPSAAPADDLGAITAQLPLVHAALYRAEREIARGGMGRIVAAEDQRLGRRVALKELLEPAGEQLGRFQREALITARLQHPGIVPVYEAGRWPTGEPFFAMKLVSGRPLDRVIAETRSLPDRLALLPRIAAAADAIAYAHSQRVVHRDLKPANVLIGDFGETVVIDWGLAKDLDANDGPDSRHALGRTAPVPAAARPPPTTSGGSLLTVAGAVMGTPAYMAPEQARGEPVDERADVFALGAMLYHLLAGVPPYNARTATDVIAAAALGRVTPLVERVRGAPHELVAIVERAMAQIPEARYPHAGELADELRRYLTGQLVSAHRYTAAQRVARFVRRHRAAVAIAGIAVIAFAMGSALAVRRIVHERDNADRERTLAVTRQRAAEQLIDEVLGDMKDRLSTIGRLDLMANLGSEIRRYYETLSTIPGGMLAEDLDRMAIAVDIVGRAERDSAQPDRAFKTWSEARARLAATLGDGLAVNRTPATRRRRAMIARLDFQLGTIHQLRGKKAAAIAAYELARTEYAALLAEAPDDRAALLGAAENHDRIGDLLRNDGKIELAFDAYAEAKAARQRAASGTTSRPAEEVMALSTSHLKLGSINQARGDSAGALGEYRAALRLRESLLSAQPDNTHVQEKLLEIHDTLAELYRTLGDLPAAILAYERVIPVVDALVRRDPVNSQWRRQRANLLADLGFTLLDDGQLRGGLAQLQAAIEAQIELLARDPENTSWTMDLAQSYARAGDGQLYLGASDDAIASYERALALRTRLAHREPSHVPYPRSIAWARTKLANAYAVRGELARAIDAHEAALAIRAKLAADAPAQVGFKNELASSEIALGRLIAARAPDRAAKLIDAGLARARGLVTADAIGLEWKRTLVQGLLAQAAVQRARGDRAAQRAALAEAQALASAATERAPRNVHWAGLAAEVDGDRAQLAAAAGDARGAEAAWRAVRDRLAPLASAGRLPVPRQALLDRAMRR